MLSRTQERLLRRITTRRGREAEGVVLLEGPRVVAAAHGLGAEMLFVVVEEGGRKALSGSVGPLDRGGTEVIEVPPAVLRDLSDTETPQGVLAVARQPRAHLPVADRSGGDRCLVLDAVADPGNVGTLVRTAAGLGADRILALDGTADPWSTKAVRASAGFAFALPIHTVRWNEARDWIDASGLPLLVADGGGEDVREWSGPAGTPAGPDGRDGRDGRDGWDGWALVMGNEAHGPRAETLAGASARLRIPLNRAVESLNVSVAGAVLLWALGPARDDPERSA